MQFKGDIIITDPCYIDRHGVKGKRCLWDMPEKEFDIMTGSGLSKFGFTSYIWEGTIYGDWSCTTWKVKKSSVTKGPSKITKKDVEDTLGHFCADAGMVGVFYLNEVLKFNPKFDYHITKPHTTTLIENFDGDIEYLVEDGENAYIRGIGNINFITTQTGL